MTYLSSRSTCTLLAMGLVISAGSAPATAKEKQLVTISYIVGPVRPLPENIKAVAVIDSGVDSDEESGDARERKWSMIAADLTEAMLQSAEAERGSGLKVVQRRATKQILAEQDLQLVGIVEGDAVARAGKLLSVDGLIMSRINIHIAVKKSSRSEIDWLGVLGGGGQRPPRDPRIRRRPEGPRNPYGFGPGRGGPGGFDLPKRQIEEISRHLTLQCSFSLVDAVTGEAVVRFAPPVIQKTDKAKPDFLFGQCIDEADLDPVDHFIGELIERAAREFVGQMAPVRVENTYQVIGRGDEGERAVRALRADDFATALREFQAAHQDDPEEHDTVFAMGITCELLGEFDRALGYYRQAAAMEDVDEDELAVYLAAKDRLTADMERIVRIKREPAEK